MTTKCICTNDMICTEQIYGHTKINQKTENSVWGGLRRLAGTIGDYAVGVYRYTNSLEPIFSNGGIRVLIRPDRIDLV